eukprot:gnl/Hemi2/28214_TR9317_c0_g1_i1.p1 gnl/Hemi2/28214_TR9317_c0_g1~~gnl/Hemi2/28214_TR9317_c0_g1_i1.p1  ORF type:complete len:286 (-),score=115.86 gnl/Hemi2/28214_TR9317_c0_g1_i1:236-1093(-)
MGCCVTVQQGNMGLVESWGKFDHVADPGLHCLNPCASSLAGLISTRVKQADIDVDTKTKDNVFVKIQVAVQYRVLLEHVYEAFYRLSDPVAQIKSYVEDVVRGRVPRLPLDGVFESKDEIAESVRNELQKVMKDFGYSIVQALVVDVIPDPQVKRAMNEINAAQRMRVAANDQAESQKIIQVKQAEGEAESKFLAGQGIARQRKAIVDGLRQSVMEFTQAVDGTTSRDVMDMMMMTQYFDMLREVGAHTRAHAVFIPQTFGAQDLAAQVRTGMITAGMVNAMPQR